MALYLTGTGDRVCVCVWGGGGTKLEYLQKTPNIQLENRYHLLEVKIDRSSELSNPRRRPPPSPPPNTADRSVGLERAGC